MSGAIDTLPQPVGTTEKSHETTGGVVVLGMIAVSVSVILLLLFLILCIVKQRKARKRKATADVTKEDENPTYGDYFDPDPTMEVEDTNTYYSSGSIGYFWFCIYWHHTLYLTLPGDIKPRD